MESRTRKKPPSLVVRNKALTSLDVQVIRTKEFQDSAVSPHSWPFQGANGIFSGWDSNRLAFATASEGSTPLGTHAAALADILLSYYSAESAFHRINDAKAIDKLVRVLAKAFRETTLGLHGGAEFADTMSFITARTCVLLGIILSGSQAEVYRNSGDRAENEDRFVVLRNFCGGSWKRCVEFWESCQEAIAKSPISQLSLSQFVACCLIWFFWCLKWFFWCLGWPFLFVIWVIGWFYGRVMSLILPVITYCSSPPKDIEDEYRKRSKDKTTFPRSDIRSSKLFEYAAKKLLYPPARYLYGRTLVREQYGHYGLDKDAFDLMVKHGLEELQEAGASGIPESFFELGAIYEAGLGKQVEKNVRLAKEYYDQCCDCCVEIIRMRREGGWKFYWDPDLKTVKQLLPTESWHEMVNMQTSVAGERFSLTVVGQSFLFGAAASLTAQVQPEHYPPLLFIVPILGLVQACLAIALVLDYDGRSPQCMMEMIESKLTAYRMLLEVGKIPEKKEGEEFQHFSQIRRRVYGRLVINQTVLVFTWIVALLYFVVWLVLLVNEFYSSGNDCGHWWLSTCRESYAQCNFDTRVCSPKYPVEIMSWG